MAVKRCPFGQLIRVSTRCAGFAFGFADANLLVALIKTGCQHETHGMQDKGNARRYVMLYK
jgi:hypothetical protein